MTNENAGIPVTAQPEVVATPTTETPKVESQVSDTTETDVADHADTEPKNDPEKLAKALDRAKRKIDRKTAMTYEQRREIDTLRRELEQLKSSASPKASTEEDPVQRYVDQRAEQVARAQIEQTLKSIEAQRSQETKAKEFNTRLDKLTERMPDIRQVIESNRDVELPNFIVDAIAAYDDGPLIAAYAFKEDLMEDIASLPPALAYRELNRIGDIVEKMTAPKPITNTPKPMTANKGTQSAGGKSIESMDSKELFNQWFKGGKRRR